MSDATPEAPAVEAPEAEAQDQPTTASQAPPETGTSATEATPEDQEFFSEDFDPASLDEALQGRYRQMQADYTRKTQELAEQRKQAESVTAALSDLRSEDPTTRQGALEWLAQADLLTEEMVAEAFGWEIEPDQPETEDIDPQDPAAIARAEIAAFKAEQAQKEQAAQEQAWVEAEDKRINTELDELGVTDQRARDQIFANALFAAQKGLTEGIDIKSAHEQFEAVFTDRQRAWRDGKQTAQPVAAGGEAATEVPDMDTHEGRVQAMMARMTPGPNG